MSELDIHEARRFQRSADVRHRLECIKVLKQAAELLEAHGWHRGSLVDGQGRRDVLQAITDAVSDVSWTEGYAAEVLAQDALAEELGLPDPQMATETRLARWNDGLEDKRVVTRALRRTAARLAEGEGGVTL